MLKPNKIRQLLAFIIVAAGVALVIIITAKAYRKKGPSPMSAVRIPPADISLKKIHYTETKKGKKSWDLTADKADYNKESESTRLVNVQLKLAGDRSTGDIDLVADRADYRNKTGDVHLEGNVKARTVSGMEFSTTTVDYIASRSLIVTSAPVSFSNRSLRVQGTGMELATDSRDVKIHHEVTATILPGKEAQ